MSVMIFMYIGKTLLHSDERIKINVSILIPKSLSTLIKNLIVVITNDVYFYLNKYFLKDYIIGILRSE